MGKNNQSKKSNNDIDDPYKIGTVLFTSGDSNHDDVWDDSELIEHWDRNLAAYRNKYSSEQETSAEPPYQHKQRKTQSGHISKKKIHPAVSRKTKMSQGQDYPQPATNQHIPAETEQQPQQPPSFLPPMPPLPSSQEELSNLIMAWYYCGYYTGLYQAQK